MEAATKQYVDGKAVNEVWVDPTQPVDPNVELWYDTDATTPTGDSGWATLSLGSGWTNYGASYGVPRYRRINNVTYTEGLVVGSGAVIATLPAGFRPSQDLIFLQHSGTAPGHARMDVVVSGNITCAGTHAFLSICTSFPADV